MVATLPTNWNPNHTPTAAELAQVLTAVTSGGQVVARGNRSSGTGTTTTVELAVHRLDSVSVVSGNLYIISAGPLALLSSVTGDLISGLIRVNTSGNATTSSTQVGQTLRIKADSFQPVSSMMSVPYVAGATGSISVLFSIVRSNGTGNVSLANGLDMWITAHGGDPGDTGVDL